MYQCRIDTHGPIIEFWISYDNRPKEHWIIQKKDIYVIQSNRKLFAIYYRTGLKRRCLNFENVKWSGGVEGPYRPGTARMIAGLGLPLSMPHFIKVPINKESLLYVRKSAITKIEKQSSDCRPGFIVSMGEKDTMRLPTTTCPADIARMAAYFATRVRTQTDAGEIAFRHQ
jgi:hypothetical protein